MMNKNALIWLLPGVGLVGWLLFTVAPSPTRVGPSAPLAIAQAEAVRANQLAASPTAITIPGVGPVPTDPAELEKFKAKSKRELLAALRPMGVFSDRQDQIRAQDSGEMAWIFIEQRKNLEQALTHILDSAVEPYPPRILAALEHILKNGTNPQTKLTAATLLYRYDQPSGKQYLLDVLNAPTSDRLTRDVALMLAMNREREAIPGIARAWLSLGPPTDSMLITLGRWKDDTVVQFLRQQYSVDRPNWGYALGLSQAGDTAVADALMSALKSRSEYPSGLKIQAALSYLGLTDTTLWTQTMEQAFLIRSRLGERALLSSLDIAGSGASAAVTQELLQSCIPLYEEFLTGMELQAKGIREKDSKASGVFPKVSPPMDFMKGAAQLLGQWGAKEAVPVLEEVLVTVQKDNRANVYLNEALGLALYRLDPDNWRNTLLNAGVPSYHVERIPGLATLRPLPAEYLPKQVNLKAR